MLYTYLNLVGKRFQTWVLKDRIHNNKGPQDSKSNSHEYGGQKYRFGGNK